MSSRAGEGGGTDIDGETNPGAGTKPDYRAYVYVGLMGYLRLDHRAAAAVVEPKITISPT